MECEGIRPSPTLGKSKGKPLGITMSTPTLTIEGNTLHTHG